MIRAQRVLASLSGISRRHAEALISEGRVALPDKSLVTIGQSVPAGTELLLDGRPVSLPGAVPAAPAQYLALHKPQRVLSAWRDHRDGRLTLTDMLAPQAAAHLLHVGRLDYESEGLLLLTSDGVWANSISHPSSGVPKTYLVAARPAPGSRAALLRSPPPRLCRTLESGVDLVGEDRAARAAAAEDLSFSAAQALFAPCAAPLPQPARGEVFLSITLQGEGRNRVLRRMLLACGYIVHRLLRVQVGDVRLSDLASGRSRELSPREVAGLGGARKLQEQQPLLL